ncbi:MAG: cohesin domain-containing protein, partial [Candidatus Daviesbacteria bacterium]|nr:cohesin domain-containing protein [Candidatus Daviesbacteria bacterium]
MKKYLALLLIFSFFSFIFPVAALAQTTSLEIDPASGPFNKGCSFTLNVQLKTGGAATEGVDAIIAYDPSRLTADSLKKGTLFPDYPISNIDSASGKIAISAIASVGAPFTGSGVFASINFTVPSTAPTGTTQVNLDFDPNNKSKTT